MPALSPTMEEGKLAKWLKKEGDKVKSGDVIAEIETDKATMEVEAVDEGTLGKILVPEGTEDVKVNTPIAVSSARARMRRRPAPKRRAAPTPAAPRGRRIRAAGGRQPARAPPPSARRNRLPAAAARQCPIPTAGRHRMVTMTVRDALRDAMAEEMRRDADVFVMGEEVAEYQGAYKITQGLLQEFGDRRVVDTPITEHGFAGLGVGAALGRSQTHRRIHDLQLRHAGDGSDHQFGGQDPLHVRRPDRAAPSCSAAPTARRPGSPPSTARIIRPGIRTFRA